MKCHQKGKRHLSHSPNLPSVDVSLLHEPGELPLGEHRIVEVESGVLPDVRLPDAQGVDEPVKLLVAVVILGGPESVGHSLQTVHDGTGEVICRIDSGRTRSGRSLNSFSFCIFHLGLQRCSLTQLIIQIKGNISRKQHI